MIKRNLVLVFCLLGVASCSSESGPRQVELVGRTVLPADTFVAGPVVGAGLDKEINGRTLPFDSLPVQGFSSLIPLGDDQFLALQDNGFGTRANSFDYPLGWFLIKLSFGKTPEKPGTTQILQTTHLSDPDEFFPYYMAQPENGRFFTGADLDPESFVRLKDGTLWVGDEFGPWLLHFSADGKLLSLPVGLPTPEEMLPFTGYDKIMRSPDHPRVLTVETPVIPLLRSGGIEGLALSHDGKFIYAAIEKKLLQDNQPSRRLIMEFDLAQGSFTDNVRYYEADGPDISLAALETWGKNELLVIERDGGEGPTAEIKRIYRMQLEATTADGYLVKELVCDLMNIVDEDGFTTVEPGALGLGPHFTFPFVTPEILVVLNKKTILVANDNNYPMSSGRRPGGVPDDTEFILLELP